MQEAGNRWNDPRLAFLEAYSAELEQEASAEDALRMRLNVILSDTAEALQSGPLSKDSWSWLGIAEQAEKLRALVESAVEVLRNHQDGKRSAERAAEVADLCQAVLDHENAYDWKPITPENLPGFDDLLLQDMNPPRGAWSVSNKHHQRAVSYEEWMRMGFRWFAKMRLPEDWTKPHFGLSAEVEK